MDVKNASWTIRKIINTKKYLEKATLKIEDAVVEGKYSIRRMYNMLSGDFPKVSWKKLICNTQANPKQIFILFLAIQERMYTKNRLIKWGIRNDTICATCEVEQESHQHLFFNCCISAKVWMYILKWLGIRRSPVGWREEISWARMQANAKNSLVEIYRMSLACTTYHIW